VEVSTRSVISRDQVVAVAEHGCDKTSQVGGANANKVNVRNNAAVGYCDTSTTCRIRSSNASSFHKVTL